MELNPRKPEKIWVEKQNSEKKYQIAKQFYKKPKILNPLFSIDSIEEAGSETGQFRDIFYIYYYPKGLGSELAIHISRTDTKASFTLYLNPIKRKFHVIKKNIPLEKILAEEL